MAEEELVAVTSPAPADQKRKLDDLEAPPAEPPTADDSNADSNSASVEKEAVAGDVSAAKRPRLEDKADGLVSENGSHSEKSDTMEDDKGPVTEEDVNKSEVVERPAEEALETVKEIQPSTDEQKTEDNSQPSSEDPGMESVLQQPSVTVEKIQEPTAEGSQHLDVSLAEQPLVSASQIISRKVEIRNDKVGVLIGKAGDTIRSLQYHSGAKIQIMRDANTDPNSATRLVELTGTLEAINKAEKLIEDVMAEADAGGSPSLVARGVNAAQVAGAAEQLQMQVPNEKVGVIIGKGGDTIKNLQMRSGARIQVIPQHLPEEVIARERTVRMTGDKKQIEMAREMINEVMNQSARPSPLSSGYNQQASRSRGSAPSQWEPRVPHPAQPTGYNYPQQGPHQSQHQQYPPHAYGNYPSRQPPPRSGHDYYGTHGGRVTDVPPSNPMYSHAPAMDPPSSQTNYGQPYPQSAPPSQSYGHGYAESKYENQAPPVQHSYGGGHGGSQPGSYYPQTGTYSQSYPRANQPGDMPYQGPVSSNQMYQNAPPQQPPYPYASSGAMQQQQTYPQQVSQPVSGYGQPGVQLGPGYVQMGQTGGYGSYPNPQPGGFTEQSAPARALDPNNAGPAYGYQAPAEQGFGAASGSAYVAPPSAGQQLGYAPPTQPGYDQSVPQIAGGYGNAQVGYNTAQYDSTQMYGNGAPHQ